MFTAILMAVGGVIAIGEGVVNLCINTVAANEVLKEMKTYTDYVEKEAKDFRKEA